MGLGEAVRRARRWEPWLNAAVVAVILSLLAWFWHKFTEVRTFWRGDAVQVSTAFDGNGLVVTHLVAKSGGETVTAQLPEAAVTFDSGGPSFDQAALRALRWKTLDGRLLPAPRPGAPVWAIYHRPAYSTWRPGGP